MKILMGVDDSKSCEILFQAVVHQFRSENTEVQLLHVLQPSAPAPPQMAPGYAPELAEQKKQSLELVERIANNLRAAGFKASTAVEVGDIRETIIASASDWGADLIVVGSHGERGIRQFLLGDVAEFVARHAKCSVQIVRPPAA
jgi:nucleotide-binding universal stress UspA family protein